ncbi:hypothetical protein ACHAPD_011119 [Fusarium lateritium]
MGFKMEWDEFLKLYAKRNRGSLTTTPGQSTLTYIFSPQDIRDAIRAPHSPESRQPSPSGQYVMPSPTYGYAPSTGFCAINNFGLASRKSGLYSITFTFFFTFFFTSFFAFLFSFVLAYRKSALHSIIFTLFFTSFSSFVLGYQSRKL